MKASIITVNLNNRNGLQRTFDSIVVQTCKNFEWIIIDGGSTDGSKEFIEQNEKHVSYWCSEKDTGIYNAMNKGVQHANGEYCLFLNSGDVLCAPNIIEKILEIPFQTEIVSFDMYVDIKSPKGYKKSPDCVNAYWLYDHYIPHPSSWIKRELLLKLPYDESYSMISDWVFFFDALVVNECSYQHVPIPISLFFSDGMSCNPANKKKMRDEGARYLPTRFLRKYIEDKAKPASFHFVAEQISDMSPFFQKLILRILYVLVTTDTRFRNLKMGINGKTAC